MDHTGNKNPAGVSLRGVVSGLGLLIVPGKGTDDQKEGEKQTQGEVTENA